MEGHAGDRSAEEAPPTGAAALHQLPPPPAGFIGREAELVELEAASASTGIHISGLRGMDGAGKTALALVLAERLTARYPDAQFYLDLRGDSLQPLSAAQAMAHVIRAYHPTARLPETEAELAALYRSVLAGQRALLLMDNAARRSQIEPLLPPRTCRLLVTSQRRFALPGLHTLNLHALPFKDAEELLLRIAPRLSPPPRHQNSAEPSGRVQAPEYGRHGRTETDLSRKTTPLLRPLSDLQDSVPPPADPSGRAQAPDDGLHGGTEADLSRKTAPLLRPLSHDPDSVPPPADPSGRAQAPVPGTQGAVPGTQDPVSATHGPVSGTQGDVPPPRSAGGALAELAHLCGCLPLALRLAASALAEREDLGVDEILERLWGDQAQGEPVEASLRLSYDLLDEDLQRHWRTLAVFPGTLNRTAAASVWGVEAKRADDILDRLLRYSLIECDALSRRYYLHDLARQYAEARLGKQERAVAERRHALHYAWVLDMANDLYLRGEQAWLRGLALFDRERTNVEAGQQWAAAHVRKDEEAAWLCSAYPDRGAYILDVRLRAREKVHWLEDATVAAHEIGDRRGTGIHLGNLGNAYRDLGEVGEAIDHYEQALAIAQETGDRRNEGAWLGNLGNVYRDRGKVKVAIDYYQRALAIARETGDRGDQGNALSNLGLAYATRGKVQQAIAYTETALETYEAIRSPYAAQTREQLARLRRAPKKKWWQFWK